MWCLERLADWGWANRGILPVGVRAHLILQSFGFHAALPIWASYQPPIVYRDSGGLNRYRDFGLHLARELSMTPAAPDPAVWDKVSRNPLGPENVSGGPATVTVRYRMRGSSACEQFEAIRRATGKPRLHSNTSADHSGKVA